MYLQNPRELVYPIKESPVWVNMHSSISALEPRIAAHFHSQVELQFMNQGQARYVIKDQVHELRRGSVLVIPGGEAHSHLPDSNRDRTFEKVSLLFSLKIFGKTSKAAGILKSLSGSHLTLRNGDIALVAILMQKIAEESRTHGEHWLDLARAYIVVIALLLGRANLADTLPVNPLILRIVKYLDEHYAEKVSLEEVAAAFNVSVAFLSREFRRCTGQGFKKYLINRRIVTAMKLLTETNMKVVAVAHAVGFDDLSTFNRDFRLLTSLRPSEYRRLATQDETELEYPDSVTAY